MKIEIKENKTFGKVFCEKGFLAYSVEDDEMVIDNLEVKEKYRGHGVARELLDYFFDNIELSNYSSEDEITKYSLYAYPQDDITEASRLIELYESYGFSESNECEGMMYLAA